MLPAGPRYTFGIPSTPQLGARQLATQVLASMQGQIAAATELRMGTVTMGCDNLPNINPLNGTTCNGAVGSACSIVLYNPQSRTVVTNDIGRAMASSSAACAPGAGNVTTLGASVLTTVPADCSKVAAALLAKRRFVDDLGNWYGPTGAWLSQFNAPATLEGDYVHRFEIGTRLRYGDPPTWPAACQLSLKKVTGPVRANVLLAYPGSPLSSLVGVSFPGQAQGLIWPSVDDTVWPGLVAIYEGTYDGFNYHYLGLTDLQFDGAYSGSPLHNVLTIVPTYSIAASAVLNDIILPSPLSYHGAGTTATYDVVVDSVGYADTFKWRENGGSWTTGVTIGPIYTYTLSDNFQIRFGNATGHTLGDSWTVSIAWGDATATPPRPDTFYSAAGFQTINLAWQNIGDGMSVKFDNLYGHYRYDAWSLNTATNNVIVRNGVAVRGTVATATACVNGGFPNNNVLLTAEMNATFPATGNPPISAGVHATGSHALVVRDPDTLALVYRLPLDHDATGYSWGDPPEKFSFSTNDEGLFFVHAYTTPVLASPPTPYPGHEFGAPNPRKIAVVSVNPTTFVPTIQSLVTLEDNEYTAGSSFAVAITAP